MRWIRFSHQRRTAYGILEGDRIERASALIHHRGDEISEAVLVVGILGRAAAKGEAHGNERIGVAFDQPCFDAAGAYHALDLHGGNLSRRRGRDDQGRHGKARAMPQQ